MGDEPLHFGRAGPARPAPRRARPGSRSLPPSSLLVAYEGRGQAELPADAFNHRGARSGVGV